MTTFRRNCGAAMSGSGGFVLAEGHDADLGDPRALKDVHDGNELLDGEFEVGPDDDGGVGFFELGGEEAGFEVCGGDEIVVELVGVVFVDRDGEDLGGVDRALGGGAFGNDEVEAVFHERGGDHENDQQHEGEVEQRGDIQLRERLEAVSRGVAAHGSGLAAAGAEFHKAVLDLGGELGGEIVGLHEHGAHGGDEEVVAEHGGDRDEEADDGGDERSGNAGCHGGEVRGAGLGDAGEGIHDAPHGAEKPKEWGSADGGGEDDHLGFELEGGLTDGAFHGGLDGAHLGRGDFLGDLQARGESVVDLGGSEHLEAKFVGAGFVDFKNIRAVKSDIGFEEAEGFAVLMKEVEKACVLALAEFQKAELCDHDGPAENGGEEECDQDEFSLDRAFQKRVDETRGDHAVFLTWRLCIGEVLNELGASWNAKRIFAMIANIPL